MPKEKRKFKKIRRSHLQIVSVLLLIMLSLTLLLINNKRSTQAMPAMVADVYFEGEYSVNGGEWKKIVEGEHIPATQGDVRLRGNFHMLAPDGEYVGIYRGDIPIAFYTDHINLTFYEGGEEYFVIDTENPIYGSTGCGVSWTGLAFMGDSDKTIEILVHNPHSYGNETAIDEMLSRMALWSGIDFEKEALNSGDMQRNTGLLLIIVSMMFLGIALFSTLIHIKNTKIIWILGGAALFAGIYFAYSADGVSFWSESIVLNTTLLGVSMMLYMLFFAMIIVCLLNVTRKLGSIVVFALGIVNAAFFVLPIVTKIHFYDTWIWWVIVQLLANLVLIGCLIREFIASKTTIKWAYIGALLPLIAFAADTVGTWTGA